MFEWYVIGCGSKNRYQKDFMCLKESGLLNMIRILGAILNINDAGEGGDHLINT